MKNLRKREKKGLTRERACDMIAKPSRDGGEKAKRTGEKRKTVKKVLDKAATL